CISCVARGGYQGRTCADDVPPDSWYAALLEALIVQEPEKCAALLGPRGSRRPWNPIHLLEPMVLVSDKPNNDIGILQTKFSHREGHEARRVGLETVPLDEDIEGGHGECQACLKIVPAPVHDLFEMADQRQHRE